MNDATIDWQKEGLRYKRAHPRLIQMAQIVSELGHHVILDVGCATATLRTLLPAHIQYYGCDISDLAGSELDDEHFCRIDLNTSPDLSVFAGRGIELVHIAGVLEYLERPAALLLSAHALVGPGGHLVASIINFEADAYRSPAGHHRGWIFKPMLPAFRAQLAQAGWATEKEIPYFGRFGLWRQLTVRRRDDADDPSTRRNADQFIVVAQAK
jgi:2-polyprenyl-3-methyl-5-hydroxy-6-metoxy-1,4-benzoquinol methylase